MLVKDVVKTTIRECTRKVGFKVSQKHGYTAVPAVQATGDSILAALEKALGPEVWNQSTER